MVKPHAPKLQLPMVWVYATHIHELKSVYGVQMGKQFPATPGHLKHQQAPFLQSPTTRGEAVQD
jgi:hypothetical protein